MQAIIHVLTHTPWWVFPLFAFLVLRGIRAFSPVETSLLQLVILPTIFTVWGLAGLNERYGFDPATLAPWFGALALGAAIGTAILKGAALKSHRTRGVLYRPADFTVLPLILVAFFSKYTLAVTAVTSPEIGQALSFRIADIGVSGIFAGIFIGKFIRYWQAYLAD